MRKNKLLLALLTAVSIGCMLHTNLTFATNASNNRIAAYTTLKDIDKSTFNEYRFYMVNEYFKLKEQFELKGSIDKTIALNLLKFAKTGYNYLPDNLINKNYYNDLAIAVKKGYETPNSEVNYEEITKKLNNYLEKVSVQSVKGSIEANPKTGNAPLTVTFRGSVDDPTGSTIPSSNFVWWLDSSGIKKVIGRGKSINYTFREEGNFAVFLDVRSTHKNAAGYTDVLPFSSRSDITVKEKVASIIVKVNSKSLKESDELKFTPEEANYGLIFDATSSTPTGGAKFTRTEWTFGNGIERKYDGSPNIERVVYSREGDYSAKLKLTTNEGKTVERKFNVAVHKPIATIQANQEDGYIGDKFVFSAITGANEKNLSYSWNIIDISNDKILASKDGSVINHVFNEKGRYNIQLKVKDAAGNNDVDTKIIYINSRSPIAEFDSTIPDKSKPNRVLLDASRSYDPDYSDDGKLKYVWTIGGEIITLDQIDSKGAIGYYTFDSIGDHSVTLEVIDPDQMSAIKTAKVKVNSILAIELFTFPRVIQREGFVKFVASGEKAKLFEWDFGDGEKKSGTNNKIEHIYKKTGNFIAKLTVKDADGNMNEVSKTIYVGDSNKPLAVISADFGSNEAPLFEEGVCNNGAYVVDRVKVVNFKGGESINIDGNNTGLSYSWKVGNKFISSTDASYKFDELGCFPVKLTVKSNKNSSIDTRETWVKVVNVKPMLTSLDVKVTDDTKDPVIVSVSAVGAKDPDGVIQSYLWYYYTDGDVEPQDFRITSSPATNFVLPKVTGNYYFVVVMKDNNDERYSSEEATSNKYSITLSGDNMNTPLIDFKVNKNSLYIGEEAIFNATVKNVLGQDITAKSEFAWDFDADGFYDKETSIGNITNKFENSGVFYAKVRVKYKGMTNVRTIEINVANILEPKFDYISLGDKYLFFNTSKGKYDKSTWDMGDGNTVTDKNYFTYTYEDGEKIHNVKLKISEGTKVKDTTQEVAMNMKNMLAQKNNEGLSLHAYPEISSNKITLKESGEKAYIYIGELVDAKEYVVDFDIEADGDLNGGKDDDIDNKNDPTFEKGGLIEIVLNDKKTQTIRVYINDKGGQVVESKDITIEKSYVKEEEIDINKIVFNGITDKEKEKLEKLKAYVKELPQEHRLKAMKYVQKLQEEWFYVNEKTKVILEFESYIDGLGISNATDIINLLESFLIEGQEDQSLRNMAYNVVKNLIPKELVEYKEIIANLDQIKENPDKLEENKVLGKEILSMIKDTSLIKNEDKVTIKTQLQVFIYGSVDNIPKEIVKEVEADDGGGNKVISLLSGITKFIGLIFGIILAGILGFFVWYKMTNKNKNIGLQDFIIEKTSNNSSNTDVLSGLTPPVKKEEPVKETITRPAVKIEETPKVEAKVKDDFEENPKQTEEEKVPDWLKGSLTPSEPQTQKTETLQSLPPTPEPMIETKIEEEKVPDWLKGALTPEPTPIEVVTEELPTPVVSETFEETKIEEEKVPDWLKGALTPEPTPIEVENEEIPTPAVSETFEETKIEEEKVPDWLKGALDTENLAKEEIPAEPVKEEAPIKKPKKKPTSDKKDETPTKTSEKKEDLWDNGMDIPDWLKSDNTPAKKDDFWTLDEANQDGDNSQTKKE